MNILVIGGTRFFGLDAVRLLLERGAAVTVLSKRTLPDELAARVRGVVADRNDAAALASIGKTAFDAVFDNVAMTAADVRTVLDRLEGNCGHYVLTSTASVYQTADAYRSLVEEDARLDDAGFVSESAYATGKRAAERELQERGRRGQKFTILRPTIVFGPGDPTGRLEYYVTRLLEGKPVGPTGFTFNPAFSRDVARLAVQLLETPGPTGRTYNVAGRETVSVADLCIRVKGILHIPGPGHDLPGSPDKPSELPGSGRFVLDIEKAIQELRFNPTPLGSWLELTAGTIQQQWQRRRT